MAVEIGSKHCVGIGPLLNTVVYGMWAVPVAGSIGSVPFASSVICVTAVGDNCEPQRPSNVLAVGPVVREPVRSLKFPPSWLLVGSGTALDKIPCLMRRPS